MPSVTGAALPKAMPCPEHPCLVQFVSPPAPLASIWSNSEGSTWAEPLLRLNCRPLLLHPSLASVRPTEGGPESLSQAPSQSLFPTTQAGTEGFRRKLPLERDPQDCREEKERDLRSGGCLRVPGVPDSNVIIVKELEVGQQKNSEDEM